MEDGSKGVSTLFIIVMSLRVKVDHHTHLNA